MYQAQYFQSQWYSHKEAESPDSNLSTRAEKRSYIISFLKVFFWCKNEYSKVCIGDMSLRKYMPKRIKPMTNRNIITQGCKTYISAM